MSLIVDLQVFAYQHDLMSSDIESRSLAFEFATASTNRSQYLQDVPLLTYKWSYGAGPYKWPHKWVPGIMTLISGVITLLKTGRGPLCRACWSSGVHTATDGFDNV